MHVEIVRGVVASRAPRAPGDVLELPASEARHLIASGHARETAAPPPRPPRRRGSPEQPEQAEADLLAQRSTRGSA